MDGGAAGLGTAAIAPADLLTSGGVGVATAAITAGVVLFFVRRRGAAPAPARAPARAPTVRTAWVSNPLQQSPGRVPPQLSKARSASRDGGRVKGIA
jgi:hypothetical protein